jgi:hypothetical protein
MGDEVKTGRPTKFTPEVGDLICSLMAEGKSLRKICSLDGHPRLSTVLDWVLKGERGDERYKAFSVQYARAAEMRTEHWAEEILDIADDDSDDAIFTEEGRRVMNSEFIQRSRVKIDTRKWLMSKMKPKKYGEKVVNEHSGINGAPIETIDLAKYSTDDLRTIRSIITKGNDGANTEA